jgi:D-alanyl-lipoteichoic acid acyltransferase DltB (MBOAT superfamily)
MVFNSLLFAAFFAIALCGAVALRARVRARNVFLLVASYVFYGSWDWRFLGLLAFSTLVDYACGRLIGAGRGQVPAERGPRERILLLASLTTSFSLLGIFKYFDFFALSARAMLQRAGIPVDPPLLEVVLPVGISFYTFQTVSYVIDVYRGDIPAERSLINFALFVSFFPQLVAGPIERASRLLPQITAPTVISWRGTYAGWYLIGAGLFKKVVLADNAAKVADWAFGQQAPGGLTVVMGVYAFAIQIYCDFSGYSDIARGTARTMGFEMSRNFNLPYFATNPSDFWQRWHISLSTWLRDYLYIPLGGNRRGTLLTYRNLMLTMVLGGLWHGAAWTFVAWGVYHGLLLCAHRVASPWLARVAPQGPRGARLWRVASALLFFQLTCVGWLLFRAENMGQVGAMLAAVATDFWPSRVDRDMAAIVLACGLLLLAVQLAQARAKDDYVLLRQPVLVRAVVYAAGILAFVWLGEYGGDAFIYFQF